MHPNEKTVRDMFASYFSDGDRSLFESSLAVDVSWRVVCLGDISGAYRGKVQVLAFIDQIAEQSQYQLTDIVSIAANDGFAAIIFRNSAVYSEAGRTDHEEVWLMHFKDGTVTEVWDYYNLIHDQMVELGERGPVGY